MSACRTTDGEVIAGNLKVGPLDISISTVPLPIRGNMAVCGWTIAITNPDKGFSGCGFELIAGLKVELGLDRVDLVGGNGRDDVNEGVDDGSMLGKVEG